MTGTGKPAWRSATRFSTSPISAPAASTRASFYTPSITGQTAGTRFPKADACPPRSLPCGAIITRAKWPYTCCASSRTSPTSSSGRERIHLRRRNRLRHHYKPRIFRTSELQNFRDAELQRCRAAELQSCRAAELQSCKAAKVGQAVPPASPACGRLPLFPPPLHQPLQVQQVLRLVRLPRPSRFRSEFHPHKVSDLPVNTIPHAPGKCLLRRFPSNLRLQRNGRFQLQAGAGCGNILQKAGRLLRPARLIFPADLQHVCAQHANFRAPFLHTCSIGGRSRLLYDKMT